MNRRFALPLALALALLAAAPAAAPAQGRCPFNMQAQYQVQLQWNARMYMQQQALMTQRRQLQMSRNPGFPTGNYGQPFSRNTQRGLLTLNGTPTSLTGGVTRTTSTYNLPRYTGTAYSLSGGGLRLTGSPTSLRAGGLCLSGQPTRQSGQTFRLSGSPMTLTGKPFTIGGGVAPATRERRTADAPRRLADAPRRVADAPRRTADAPRRTADAPRKAMAERKNDFAPRKTGAPRVEHTPSVELRVKLSVTCGSCHNCKAPGGAQTVVRRPAPLPEMPFPRQPAQRRAIDVPVNRPAPQPLPPVAARAPGPQRPAPLDLVVLRPRPALPPLNPVRLNPRLPLPIALDPILPAQPPPLPLRQRRPADLLPADRPERPGGGPAAPLMRDLPPVRGLEAPAAGRTLTDLPTQEQRPAEEASTGLLLLPDELRQSPGVATLEAPLPLMRGLLPPVAEDELPPGRDSSGAKKEPEKADLLILLQRPPLVEKQAR